MKFAVLIDAGFLKRQLVSRGQYLQVSNVRNFVSKVCALPALRDARLYRVFYYDAEPFAQARHKPLSGGALVRFSETALALHNTVLLDALKREPYFAVRLGETVFRGWGLKPQLLKKDRPEITITAQDLVPAIQQKGVDMRIGLDIASLSLKKQVDCIVLASADSDFIPALKFARMEGVQTILITLTHTLKPELYAHCDVLIEAL